jgi:allophanate hydrolase
MSIFALTTDDAHRVLAVAEGFDATDAFSRHNPFANSPRHYGSWQDELTLGVIPDDQLAFFGDEDYAHAYQETLVQIQALGWQLKEIDFQPFLEAAKLLYEGPWVAERYMATLPLIEDRPEALHPTTEAIIRGGATPKATDLFAAEYRLEALRQECQAQWQEIGALLTPTAGRHYRIEEIEADPIALNANLGYYTNFMNLLDLCAVAVPGVFTKQQMPFGVTLVGPAFQDRKLLSMANRIQQHLGQSPGATAAKLGPTQVGKVSDTAMVDLVVCGAHMADLPLNWQLQERGARLLSRTQTAPCYRLLALAGGPPLRPGLIYDKAKGAAIEAEIWRLPMAELGSFVAAIPAPLGIGKVEMADGRTYSGFICEARGAEGAQDITVFGGWRAWLSREGVAAR